MSKQFNKATSSEQPKRQSPMKKHDIGLSDKERIFVHALRALFDPKGKGKSVVEVEPKGYVSGQATAGPSEKKGVASGSKTTGGRSRFSRKKVYRATHGKGNFQEKRSTAVEASSEKKKLSPSELKRAEKRADKRKAYKAVLHPNVAKASTVKRVHESLPVLVPGKSGSPQTLFDTLKKGVEELEVVTAWGGISALRSLASIGRQDGQGAKRKALSYKGTVYRPHDILPLYTTVAPPAATGDTVWDNIQMADFDKAQRRKLDPTSWKNARFEKSSRDFSKIGVAELDLQKCRSDKAKLFHSFQSLGPSQVTSPGVKAKKAVATAKAKAEVTPQGAKTTKQNSHSRRVERRKELREKASQSKGKTVEKTVEPSKEEAIKAGPLRSYYTTAGYRKDIASILEEVILPLEKKKITPNDAAELLSARRVKMKQCLTYLDEMFGYDDDAEKEFAAAKAKAREEKLHKALDLMAIIPLGR
jgi:hypothetical protein